jgi:hypothetical protein
VLSNQSSTSFVKSVPNPKSINVVPRVVTPSTDFTAPDPMPATADVTNPVFLLFISSYVFVVIGFVISNPPKDSPKNLGASFSSSRILKPPSSAILTYPTILN